MFNLMLLKCSRKKKSTETYPPVKYLPFTVDESRWTVFLKRDKREKGIFFRMVDVVGRTAGATSRPPASSPLSFS